ncbi:MAG: glycine zipper 2TM domain-containing protein [Ferruginibacter sp.]|nr:glycine zipper 2TM domain-containing protein [Rhodoferax sp.]
MKSLSHYATTAMVAGIAAVLLSVSGCEGMTRQQKGTATGAVIGGVAGNVLGGGALGTAAGAAVGGVIGHETTK